MNLEFTWLKKIDFFPSRPGRWEDLRSICVGTKSRNLGDALVLTTLPRKLHEKLPGLKITTYPRAFNPIVFQNNPHVSGVSYLPRALYGDDCNLGEGHLIRLKEAFFELESSGTPRPEIHLSASEKKWAENLVRDKLLPANRGKPLCVIHPWGTTRSKVADLDFWDRLVTKWSPAYRFWQVGVEGHRAIQGCEFYALTPRSWRYARQLFSVMSQADAFIGVDSGPMHAARAFDIPSLIFLDHADPELIFGERRNAPYFLYENWRHSTLYSENIHLNPSIMGAGAVDRRLKEFFEAHRS